jgi:capsular polysaccharide biosynthesis protein
MFECLPRILLIDRFPEYAEWPLLVGRDYLPQHYELLELVLQGRRPLLKLGREESIKIDRLVIPSIRSFMPDDPRLRPERSAVDPAAVLELRDALRPASAPPPKNNLLYVSRRKYANARPWTRVRDVANAEQMDRLLQSYGARILHPEEESIENQRLAFHHAGTVVALAGSALANLVFCRPGTRVFILSQEHRVHPSLFTGIAQTLGLRPALITGPGVPDPGPETHWNVRIDPETLKRAILSDAASTELEVAKP